MKKVLSLFLTILLAVCFSLGLVGCKEKPKTGMTMQEASAIYKQAAKSGWEMLGYNDPTEVSTAEASGTTTMSARNINTLFPDFTLEDFEEGNRTILGNLARTNLYVNLLGDLYANENFVLTDKIVTFNVSSTFGGPTALEVEVSIYAKIDKANDTIYVEAAYLPAATGSYNFFIINMGYDFDAKQTTDFRSIYYEPGYIFNDQKYTAEGKCYIAASSELPQYQESLDNYVNDFVSRKESGVFLTANFDEEFQRVSDLAAKLDAMLEMQ